MMTLLIILFPIALLGSRSMVLVLLLLGLVLAADAIGWFLGVPLIAVG